MINSLYDYLLEFREVGGELVERLKSSSSYHIFQPLAFEFIDNRQDGEKFNQALLYILMLYTKKSPHWQLGMDWGENKAAIADSLGIDMNSTFAVDLLELRSYPIHESVKRYLELQGSRDWSHLSMLYDLYDEMVVSARSPLANKDGRIDYTQKKMNSDYAHQLLAEIQDFETRIQQDENDLRAAKAEAGVITQINTGSKSSRYSMKLESVIAEVKATEARAAANRKKNKEDEENKDKDKDNDE